MSINIRVVPPTPPRRGCLGSKFVIYMIPAFAITLVVFFIGLKPIAGFFNGLGDGGAGKGSTKTGALVVDMARQYNDLGYHWGGGHEPAKWLKDHKAGSKQGLDCSGLIDVAVYIVTGGKINSGQVAEGFRNDKNWSNIDMSDARTGDIVWRIPPHGGSVAHVAIVTGNSPSAHKVTVFEAYSSRVAYSDQIRQHTYDYGSFDGASRLKYDLAS